jgi:hypothetical protein
MMTLRGNHVQGFLLEKEGRFIQKGIHLVESMIL